MRMAALTGIRLKRKEGPAQSASPSQVSKAFTLLSDCCGFAADGAFWRPSAVVPISHLFRCTSYA